MTEQEVYMNQHQEAGRKDVERPFGCLQGRFQKLWTERHEWSDESLIIISNVCVRINNMIVAMIIRGELSEEEGEGIDEFFEDCLAVKQLLLVV